MSAQKNRRKLVEVLLMELASVSRRQEKTDNVSSSWGGTRQFMDGRPSKCRTLVNSSYDLKRIPCTR